ncbi:MAG: hypothetical protein KDK90_25995 [Leptospiraceae bacterium]|nr:hypothetical protein [Leptospiraceae bacterium]
MIKKILLVLIILILISCNRNIIDTASTIGELAVMGTEELNKYYYSFYPSQKHTWMRKTGE